MTVHELDDTEPEQATAPLSDLQRLAADIAGFVAPPFDLKHPGLPAYTLRFRSDLQVEELDKWRKVATRKKGRGGDPDDLDQAKLAALVVNGCCLGILRDGAELTDSNDRPVRFGSREFLDLMHVGTGADAVQAFLVKDAWVAAMSRSVLEHNGYGDEAEEADPTVAGS